MLPMPDNSVCFISVHVYLGNIGNLMFFIIGCKTCF